MRLTQVEISGFKSFVDATKISLSPGISAIVGPNGCGKSNIVDAIRWGLGEHSARQLRGGVMDDLIFQGSATRAPVSICDVELTFACTLGILPPPYHELEEVRIRRRQMREGGSDAFINGKPVRLKDIVDLFLGTGISTRAYAIIEQGAIARMITAKPEERRQLLEEAAGVVKYRSRRRDAERKMDQTSQNMERVLDLQEEVRSQCRSLKKQAARAERFTALQQELALSKTQSMALRFRQQQQKVTDQQQQVQHNNKETEQAQSKLLRQQRLLVQLRRSQMAHEEDTRNAHDALLALEQKRGSLQQMAERRIGEQRLLEERRSMLELNIEQGKVQIEQYEESTENILAALTQLESDELHIEHEAAQYLLQNLNEERQQARQQRDQCLTRYEQERARQQQLTDQQSHRLAARLRWQQRNQQCEQQRQTLQQGLEEQGESVAVAEDHLIQLEAARESSIQHIQQMQIQHDVCAEQQRQYRHQCDSAEHHVTAKQSELRELQHQHAQQGIDETLLDRLRQHGVLWLGECELEIPEGLELAVAAALHGDVADAILPVSIKKSEQLLNDCREVAKQAALAFFDESGPKLHEMSQDSLATALGLEVSHPLFPMFAHVQLSGNLFDDHAQQRLVNRDGWRREVDGWIIPPRQRQSARALMLQQRILSTKDALEQAMLHLDQHEQEMHQRNEQLRNDQQAQQQAKQDAENIQLQWHSANSTLQQLQLEKERTRTRQNHLNEESEALAQEASLFEQAGDDEEEAELARVQLEALQQQLEQQEQLQQQSEDQWQQTSIQCAQLEKNIALQRQQQGGLQQKLHEEKTAIDTLHQRDEEHRRNWQQLNQLLDDMRQQQFDDTTLQLLAEEMEQAQITLHGLRESEAELQKRGSEADQQAQDAQATANDCSQELGKAEASLLAAQQRLEELDDEIMQQWQQAPAELLYQCRDIPDDVLQQAMQRLHELDETMARFGPVNLLAINEYEEASERENFLNTQIDDLNSSLDVLKRTIIHIDQTTRQRFRDVFNATNKHFQRTFPRLFGGGSASLKLDGDDVLTAGVEVVAQPPGKRLQSLALLSGGEKALTAVALVFAIFQIKPAPFCILDEVDAPLDDANTTRFAEMIRELSVNIQFLAISHNKITMKHADTLLGVSMPEDGVSKIIQVVLDDSEVEKAST